MRDGDQDLRAHLLRAMGDGRIDLDLVLGIAGERELSSEERRIVDEMRDRRGRGLYSDLLFTLTTRPFPEDVAETLWCDILGHRRHLEERLGRRVGVAVATLDYLTNVRDDMVGSSAIPQRSRDAIAEAALRDGLTGLVDRATLEYFLEEAVRRFERYGHPLSLIALDVDDFKQVNDRHGHQRGDEVLARLGRVLEREVREVDVVGRYGGEEFAVILPEADAEEAEPVADRLRAAVEDEFATDLGLTVSLGLAGCPEHGTDSGALLRAADRALYRAKNLGKNRVEMADREPTVEPRA